jgi:hypothetical protein
MFIKIQVAQREGTVEINTAHINSMTYSSYSAATNERNMGYEFRMSNGDIYHTDLINYSRVKEIISAEERYVQMAVK